MPTPTYYAYLALYNAVYILPLAGIVGAFTLTLGRRKLQEREGRLLKLASGIMMLELGVILLVRPTLLQSIPASVMILLGAVGLTAAIALLDGREKKPGAKQVLKSSP